MLYHNFRPIIFKTVLTNMFCFKSGFNIETLVSKVIIYF